MSRTTSPGTRHRWRPGVVALAVLALTDVVLVKLAFDHVDLPVTVAEARQGAPVQKRDDAQGASPVPTRAALPDGPLRLALSPEGVVLVGSVGVCGDVEAAESVSAQLLVSPGPSSGLRAIETPGAVAEVLAVEASSQDDLSVVGADGDCRPRLHRGGHDGRSWSSTTADPHWYVDSSGLVHAPGGRVEVPCTPAQLSTVGAVRLLCEGGSLLGTPDMGKSWVALGRVDRAAAFAFDSATDGVALVAQRGCPVAVAVTSNGGASWARTACIEGSEGRAVGLRSDDVAAVVDDVLWRSSDGGETWARSRG